MMAMKPISSFFTTNTTKPAKGSNSLLGYFTKTDTSVKNKPTKSQSNEDLNGKSFLPDDLNSSFNDFQDKTVIAKSGKKETKSKGHKGKFSKVAKPDDKPSVKSNGVAVIEPSDTVENGTKEIDYENIDPSVEMSYEDYLNTHDEGEKNDTADNAILLDDEASYDAKSDLTNSELSQDMFSEEIVSGSRDITNNSGHLDRNYDCSNAKKLASESAVIHNGQKEVSEKCQNIVDLSSEEDKVTISIKSEENSSKMKPGKKQMTLFGKIITDVPNLEETDVDVAKNTEADSSVLEEAPKSKNIMSFFSKVDKKFPNGPKKCDSEKVTCLAMVHLDPSEKSKLSPTNSPEDKKITPKRRSNVVVEAMDMSITQLDSMVITMPEKKKRSPHQIVNQSENAEYNKQQEDNEPEVIKDSHDDTKESELSFENIEDSLHDSSDVIIEKVEEKPEVNHHKSLLANQMTSLDKVTAPKKTTQATLNFSGKGCVIQKALKDAAKVDDVSVKQKCAKENKLEDSNFEIGLGNKSKKKKKSKKRNRHRTPTKEEQCSPQSPVKTPSKKVYSAKILPRQNSRSGLRMRFTKIRDLSTGRGEDIRNNQEMLQLTAKMTKAQQILDKAKKSKHAKAKGAKSKKPSKPLKKELNTQTPKKKKSTNEEEHTPGLRRSSRQSSLAAKVAISDCLSPPSDSMSSFGKQTASLQSTPKTEKKCKKRDTGKNDSQSTPRSKAKVKLAPIFKKKCAKTNEGSDDDVEVTKVQIDPELLRIRREFLMSGVPEVLKKQAENSCTTTLRDYPPFPDTNHVQQKHEGNIWNLEHVTLPRLKICGDDVVPVQQLHKGVITDCVDSIPSVSLQHDKKEMDEFEEETLKYLLAEVSARNPSFPVRRVYKQLVKKRKQTQGTWVEPEKPKEEKEDAKDVAGKKRKLAAGDAEEGPSPRRSKRRRAGSDAAEIRRQSLDDCYVVQEPAAPEDLDKSKEVQWTDKYSPSSTAEVLGNMACSKKLKTWLEEWRQKTNLEVKKIKIQLMKEAKKDSHIKEEIEKKLGDDWWTDDESDFDIDTEDDSDYEDCDISNNLCNTVVLTGPHGVGKTALVYALAQELGYKVFEVNASSKRAGKQMLAELQEATQSHQVGRTNMDKLFTTFKMLQDEKKKAKEAPKPEKKMNSMFSNFFTSKAKTTEQGKQPEKTKTKKTPEKKRSPETKVKANAAVCDKPTSPKKGLNLNSTSLILFEEVDVIFKEDAGFWSAIETFMNTTKRPIILTASDPKVASCISGRNEVIKLKPCPVGSLTSYLQLVCLAEKLRTHFDDLSLLVHSCKGDIRQAMLKLQFWVLSGAGSVKNDKPILYSPVFFNKKQELPKSQPPSQESRQALSVVDSGKDSEDEFEIGAKRRRRVARVFVGSGDDSSNASPVKPLRRAVLQTTSQEDSLAEDSLDEASLLSKPVDSELPEAPVKGPLIQELSWYSLAGPSIPRMSANQDILKLLKEPFNCTGGSQLASWFAKHNINLVYSNLFILLDLPKTRLVPPNPPQTQCQETIKKRKRIRMFHDIFDCEDSGDESSTPVEPAEHDMDIDSEAMKDNMKNSNEILEKPVPTADEFLQVQSVKALAELYDDLSFTDAYISLPTVSEGPCGHNQDFSWTLGKISPGLTDSYSEEGVSCDSMKHELMGSISVRAVHRTNSKLHKVHLRLQSLDEALEKKARSKMCLPVPAEDVTNNRLHVSEECSSQTRLKTSRRAAIEYVSSCLPNHMHCGHRAVSMDVMPYVRTICQTEQLRQITNTRRRFMHYLDSTSLCITRKQAVLDTLCSSFK